MSARVRRPDPLSSDRSGPSVVVGPGIIYRPAYLDHDSQVALVSGLRDILAGAPLFVPRMPRTGKPFSVRMTNCGPLGWVSDEGGYRYQATHPDSGAPWPPIPDILLAVWQDLADYPRAPQACLINVYDAKARMGLHQDRDEEDFAAP
ncbi:MAG: alpha-ketoglutarate-dependent dioxygenase AlkB, partial [Methylobacteriaceae bacterium]|nr:alpha-ketoglutarate-dependent dioxygenase AlkB [Methylobacteriaceae bacterium]